MQMAGGCRGRVSRRNGSMWASTPTDKTECPFVGADAHIRPELLADLIAFSPLAKIEVRLRQAVGGARPRRILIIQICLLSKNKKTTLSSGLLFLELLARFELATSSLPRMRSTD